jgi:dTDP-4-amino-4,6-dideoxygalactose transaminase
MKVPLMDLQAQYKTIQGEIDGAIKEVLQSGHFILGPNVQMLEREVAEYLGVAHAVGVASGTDALVLSLRAMGVGAGDEVIMPAYTFFATAGAVLLVGAKPTFVDIHPETYCLDAEQVLERLTSRTKAIIPVHLYGQSADMSLLEELRSVHGLKVIEDNAQAFGAEYRGRKTGSIGDAGCLSFFPSKNLGAYGDGGMVVTNDASIADELRRLRTHGWRKKYYPEVVGYNSRLDELQAAILRVKLRHVDAWNDRRRSLASQYSTQLSSLGIGVPHQAPYATHAFHLYVIRVEEREKVQQQLSDEGVASAVYYPQPVHLSGPCRSLGHREGDFPVSEAACRETLAIPLYPEMTEEQFQKVLEVVERAVSPQHELVIS